MTEKKWGKRQIASILAAVMLCSALPAVPSIAKAGEPLEGDVRWQEVEDIVSGIVGRYTEPPSKSSVESNVFTAGMLLGNGAFGVVSDARENEQSFYLAGQDVWNNNQKIMSAQLMIRPFAEEGKLEITVNDEKKSESKGVNALTDQDPQTYWISQAESDVPGPKWIVFDFGRKITIDEWRTTHRGYMDINSSTGEHNTRYNTRNFNLQTSEDGQNWTDADAVLENTDFQVDRKLQEPVTSQYFRIYIVAPVQPGYETAKVPGDRAMARISEVDFLCEGKSLLHEEQEIKVQRTFKYANSDSGGFNASASRAFDDKELTMWRSDTQAERVDGKTIPHDKWVSVSCNEDLTFNRVEIKHNGVNFPEETKYNTYDYQLQVSQDGSTWETIKNVEGNTESINEFVFDTPVTAKNFRMYITTPVHPDSAAKHYKNDMTNARISDINLYMDDQNVIVPEKEYDGKYYHEQDILNAEVRSRQEFNGELVAFRSWVADDRNFLITDITLDGQAAEEVELELSLTSGSGFSPAQGASDGMIWLTRESGSNYRSKSAAAVRVLKGESREEGNSRILSLQPGETAQIVTYAHSSSGFTNGAGLPVKDIETLKGEALTRLEEIQESDLEQKHQAHLEWWKNYWMQSYVDIDNEVLQRYYYGALYGLGCTIRPTAETADQPNVPGAMMGVWQTNDTCASGGRGYTNYNYEAPYYGIFSSNRGFLMDPYYEECTARLTDAQNRAAKAGYRGVQFERSIAPVYNYYNKKAPAAVAGTKAPGKLPTDQKSNVMLYTQALIWDWMYYQDEERLKKDIYPSIKQTVEFYLDFLVKKEDGKYWVENSANNELNASSSYDVNPVLDIGYVRSHFQAFMDMSEYLGENLDMLPQMQEVLDNLSPYPTSENAETAKDMLTDFGFDANKEVVVSGYYSDNYDQIKASNCPWGSYIYEGNQPVALEGLVHPAENVSLSSDPELLGLAKDTFEYFNPLSPYYRGGGYNGFPKSFTIAARLGIDGNYIVERLEKTIATIWRENLTCNNGSAHGIESFGTIEAINSMMLQNENGELRVFPSWAKNTDAKFTDLRAKDAFLVSSEYQAATQKVSYVDLISEKGNQVDFVSPWSNGINVTDGQGDSVPLETSVTKNTGELLFTFETKAGESYHITESQVPLGEVEEVRIQLERNVIFIHENVQAEAVLLPESTLAGAVKWSSSHEEVAAVDQRGGITGLKAGTADITAESILSPGKKDTVRITVEEKLPERILITGQGDGTLMVNNTIKLKAEVLPAVTTNKQVVWESSDPAVLTVQKNGIVKGISFGKAVVTVSCEADPSIKATVEMKVTADPKGYPALKCDLSGVTIETGSTAARNYTMGYSFEVKNPVTISALGFYDQNGDGKFSNTESQIAIWKLDGELVVKDAVVPETPADSNGFCYAVLENPVQLAAGTYVIGGEFPLNSSDVWFHSFKERPFSCAPQIEYLMGGYNAGASELTMPVPDAGKNYFYCVNFKYIDKNALKEQIERAEGFRESEEYTQESWSRLQEQLIKAKEVWADAAADQSQIEEAIKGLEEGIQKLQKIKDELEEALKLADEARKAAEEAKMQAEEERILAQAAREKAEEERTAAEAAQKKAEEERAAAETAKNKAESERIAAEAARRAAEEAQAAAEEAKNNAETDKEAAAKAQEKAAEAQAAAQEAQQKAAESMAAAEDARKKADAAAEDAGALKAEAEKARAQALEAQAKAETAQREAEAAREEAVQLRAAAEEARKQAEEERKAAEEARKQAEAERKAAEEAKKQAEEEQKAAEEARKKAEEERKAAEEARKQAEEEQKAAEEARKQAEAERQAAEEAERKAEEERKAAEEAGRNAEAERAAAEEARKKAAEEKAAAEAAREKAEQAEKKVQEARKAVEEAQKKAEAARKAAESAQKKIEEAEKQQSALVKGKTYKKGSYKYKVKSAARGKASVILAGSTNRNLKKAVIPTEVSINGITCKVVEIGAKAFKNYKKLNKVTVGRNVEKIGSQAFYGVKSLKDIRLITEKLKSAGSKAFCGISSRAVIRVPKEKKKVYSGLLKGKGQKKTVKIK